MTATLAIVSTGMLGLLAARDAELDFLVFMEDFASLTEGEFAQLKTEWRAATSC